SADFLLDPIHLPINGRTNTDERVFGYLVGSYCLEQELILKRKIQFNSYPEIGDLILFPNSAGYMMHFYESEAHLFELAKNIFIPHRSATVKSNSVVRTNHLTGLLTDLGIELFSSL